MSRMRLAFRRSRARKSVAVPRGMGLTIVVCSVQTVLDVVRALTDLRRKEQRHKG